MGKGRNGLRSNETFPLHRERDEIEASYSKIQHKLIINCKLLWKDDGEGSSSCNDPIDYDISREEFKHRAVCCIILRNFDHIISESEREKEWRCGRSADRCGIYKRTVKLLWHVDTTMLQAHGPIILNHLTVNCTTHLMDSLRIVIMCKVISSIFSSVNFIHRSIVQKFFQPFVEKTVRG